MVTLPAADRGQKLVQSDAADQRQQDTHEFLSQLLDCLGETTAANGESPSTPRGPSQCDSATLEALEKELTAAARVSRRGDPQLRNLLYEYSVVQWAASATRMHSRALSQLFEGQRLACMKCRNCDRYCASGAEPFTLEEVKLCHDNGEGWMYNLSYYIVGSAPPPSKVTLRDLLRENTEAPAPEGYRCPNKECAKVGSSARYMKYLRLPQTLVFHINRVQADGGRCETLVEFDQTIDLAHMGLVAHFGQPLNRDLEPCTTRYHLVAVVFHRGATARSGHYFAYAHFEGEWMRLDDEKVTRPSKATDRTPMAFEASQSNGGARAALLFYQREAEGA